jgi:cholesterol oxidase
MKVLVLSAPLEVKDYPSQSGENWIYNNDYRNANKGWIDWRFWGNMTVVVGCRGRRSLIYANVSAPAHRECFNQGWPPELPTGTDSYYDRVGKCSMYRPFPTDGLPTASN